MKPPAKLAQEAVCRKDVAPEIAIRLAIEGAIAQTWQEAAREFARVVKGDHLSTLGNLLRAHTEAVITAERAQADARVAAERDAILAIATGLEETFCGHDVAWQAIQAYVTAIRARAKETS